MSKEREALKLALEALEYISSHYMSLPKIGCMALAAVEEALAEQTAQGCDYCNHPQYAGTKCKNCGREQPAQQWSAGVPSLYPEPEPGVSIKAEYEQPAQQTCLVANEPCKHDSWCSEVYCQEHCKFVEQPAQHDLKPKFVRNVDGVPCITLVEHEHLMRSRSKPAQQEPVAWVCYGSASDEKHTIDYQQEDIDAVPVGTMLYTSPPASKPWVGLTDEEWQEIDASLNGKRDLARIFVKAIEAKLREKNV